MNRTFKVGLLYIILMIGMEIGGVILKLPPNVNLYFGQYITIALPVVILAVLFRVDLKERFKFNKIKLKTIPYLIIIFLAALPITTFMANLTTFLFGLKTDGIDAFVGGLSVAPYQKLFILAITPAICEELMFRGLLLDKKSGLNMHALAILSGVMFALFHVGYDQLLYTFALGVIYAYVAIITKSIFSTMLLHFINNGFGTIIEMIFGKLEATEVVAENAITISSLLPQLGVAVLGLIIIIVILKRLIKIYEYNDKKRIEENLDDVKSFNKKSKLITFLPQLVMLAYVIVVNVIL